MKLFTVGHSNHSLDDFIALLKQHGISAIADVRSSPYSRYVPQFNKAALQAALAKERISYTFLGRELGARPKNPDCYIEGKALYERIAATELFHEGIGRVLQGVRNYRIALMCAEKDPLTCHRAVLVCQHLREVNLDIQHILKDGELESHDSLEERMLNKHGFTQLNREKAGTQLSLIQHEIDSELCREEAIAAAYQLHGSDLAYKSN